MACRAPVADRPFSLNVTLQTITTAGQVNKFIQVNGDAYANQGATAETVASSDVSKPGAVLSCPDLVTLIAYDEGQPMAAGHLLLSRGVGGIYWVGTTQAAGEPSADQRGVPPRRGRVHAPMHRHG